MKFKLTLAIVIVGLIVTLVTSKSFFSKPQLKFLDGVTTDWSDFSGDWVVVNYFAQWCAPCLREIPELNHFYSTKTGKNIKLIGMSYDELTAEELRKIQQKYEIRFPLLHPEYPNHLLNNKPRNLPATFIISPNGVVLEERLGEQTSETLTDAIERLSETL